MPHYVKILLGVGLIVTTAIAQSTVVVSDVPVRDAVETRYYRDGSNNTEYICIALATQPKPSTWARSSSNSFQPGAPASLGDRGTLTSIAVAANVGTLTTSIAHGYAAGQWITISGGTVDTDLNGTYKITAGSGTTFTITTANVDDATYTETTLQFTTTVPRTNVLVWSVQRLYWTTSYPDRVVPAQGTLTMNKACDSRTTYF